MPSGARAYVQYSLPPHVKHDSSGGHPTPHKAHTAAPLPEYERNTASTLALLSSSAPLIEASGNRTQSRRTPESVWITSPALFIDCACAGGPVTSPLARLMSKSITLIAAGRFSFVISLSFLIKGLVNRTTARNPYECAPRKQEGDPGHREGRQGTACCRDRGGGCPGDAENLGVRVGGRAANRCGTSFRRRTSDRHPAP